MTAHSFPTTAYDAGEIYYLPVNVAMLPFLQGGLAEYEKSLLWEDETTYQRAYNALAETRIAMSAIENAEVGTVLAGPIIAPAGSPRFRKLVLSDLPAIAFADLAGIPDSFPPMAHASSHAAGGADPITPASIGAAAADHTHSWNHFIVASASAAANAIIESRNDAGEKSNYYTGRTGQGAISGKTILENPQQKPILLNPSGGGVAIGSTAAVNHQLYLQSATGIALRIDGAGNIATAATAGTRVLPSAPAGFFVMNLSGSTVKIPYYNF